MSIRRGTDLHVRRQITDELAEKISVVGTPGVGDTIEWDGSDWVPSAGGSGATTNQNRRTIYLVLDGGGQAITTGIKADVRVPYSGTITGWELVANASGSIVIDVWKDTYANFPPTVVDTITGTEKPTLSSATKNTDTALSTWTTSLTAGDNLRFNVDSASTVARVSLAIMVDAT